MAGILNRLRQAYHWARAVKAYEKSRYDEAVAQLQASDAISPLTLPDQVLLANAFAGNGDYEAASTLYAACMQRSAERYDDTSSFIFAYAAYMRATVRGDSEALTHFGRQLSSLQRPDTFRAFVKPDWLP